jgi:hypothetical protein
MLSHALQGYSSKFNNDINNKDYYLYWLENDILLELNDNKAMMHSIQPNIQKAFPKMSCFQINEKLNSNKTEPKIKESIENLWKFLPEEGRKNLASKY